MIGRLLSYSYGNARSRALATRLLLPAEVVELTESRSREQATALLDRRFSPGTARQPIEHRLQADWLDFGRLILRTLPEPAADLLRNYFERNWVENLQALCRIVQRSSPAVERPQPLPVLNLLPLPEPGEVASLDELAAHLPAGPYRQALQILPETTESFIPILIENRLLQAYWQAVAASADRLPAFDRFAAREILGLRADIDALRILRRGRKAGLTGDQLLGFWPPLARLLDLDRLRRVLKSSAPEAGLRHLLQRAVGSDVSDDHFENALRRRLQRELRRSLVSPPFDISVPLSALLLKELEVMDLQGILAGLRYGLGPEEIGPFVSCLKG
jgi:vacuolar-type H+-ATPase subunit C/Vma6